MSTPRVSPPPRGREWSKTRLRESQRAKYLDPAKLRKLTLQHQEARIRGASGRIGEMGAYAALYSYIDKHGGEYAVLAELCKRLAP